MRKFLFAAVALLVAVPSFADSFGARVADAVTNPLLVGGGKYLVTAPAAGSRAQFVLTANVPGFRLTDQVYLAGAGVALQTVVPGLEQTAGAGISLPALTYFINGTQFVVQAGYAWDLMQTPASGGPYVGVGFSVTSAQAVKAKRLAKEAKQKKAAITEQTDAFLGTK